jgi:predicted secreted protein
MMRKLPAKTGETREESDAALHEKFTDQTSRAFRLVARDDGRYTGVYRL